MVYLQYGDAVYNSEPLSCFRIHSSQNSNKPDVYILEVIAWYKLIKQSYETGIIRNLEEHKTLLNYWLKTFVTTLENFVNEHNYTNNKLKHESVCIYKEVIDNIVL